MDTQKAIASLPTNTGAAAQLSAVRSERLFFAHARELQITIENCSKFGHFKNRMLPGNNLYKSEEEKRKLNVLTVLQVRLFHSELWVHNFPDTVAAEKFYISHKWRVLE